MAAPTFTLVKTAPGGVDNAPNGKIRVFANVNNSMLYTIDEFGTVRPNGVGLATDLATTGDPVVVDSGAAPSPGYVLRATAGPGSPVATWQALPPALPAFSAEQTGAIVATADEFVQAEINIGGNATVALPTAAAAGADALIGVKVTSVAGGNTVTINTTGGDTTDGAASYVMSTDYEWIILKSDGVSEWRQVG